TDVECRGIAGVDRGRKLLGLLPVEDLHDGKVVIDPPLRISDLEDFAVTAGLMVGTLDRYSFGAAAVAKGPLIARDLARSAPGTRAVQRDLLAYRDQMVGSRNGDKLRFVLSTVGLPEEGICILDTPLAGGLFGLDVEVEMRPAAAAALFPQHTDRLSSFHALAWLDGLLDGFQVGVAIEPAVRVEDVDIVVIPPRLVERGLAILRHGLAACRNDQPVAGGDDFHYPLAATDVIAGVIVDGAFGRRPISPIDVGRLIADLGRPCKPALPGGIAERPRFHPGRLFRPQP